MLVPSAAAWALSSRRVKAGASSARSTRRRCRFRTRQDPTRLDHSSRRDGRMPRPPVKDAFVSLVGALAPSCSHQLGDVQRSTTASDRCDEWRVAVDRHDDFGFLWQWPAAVRCDCGRAGGNCPNEGAVDRRKNDVHTRLEFRRPGAVGAQCYLDGCRCDARTQRSVKAGLNWNAHDVLPRVIWRVAARSGEGRGADQVGAAGKLRSTVEDD
jgi:hypothetical protein